MASTITHLPAKSRYLYLVDGEIVGRTDYRLVATTIHLTHTEISPELRGCGLGDDMVRQILDEIADTTSHRVVAACPFVAAWLSRHPAYRGLETREA